MPTSRIDDLDVGIPEELPIARHREEIAAALTDHQVVVVAGETGSGKTTQLPKICLAAGRGRAGAIGHTQPRRIAARTVAERIADETGTALGDLVGYQVRFTDRTSDDTVLKVMTDGILLTEIQHDRDLSGYDTIIIDEAHERSLNIDFLLGYFKRLLRRRPDLRLIITSATIDPTRFADHFGGAPVIEVSGRTYPVEVRYRELVDDQTQSIVDAVAELVREGPGDILVFLSGEQEIRDAADALAGMTHRRPADAFDVLPLFSRLSAADQRRVFAPHTGRRVVLATNVAETSLTVPGIHYVVDTGLARISRYSARTKVQRLPIEPISRASADQRKGRCGRVAAGVCIRLYAEEDYAARPAFTEPEILRTNLASVILQMTALGLGEVSSFPFLDPPDERSVQAGVELLHELGALRLPHRKRSARVPGGRPTLTAIGRRLARLPVDPRLGRMLVEASRNGCLREVVTIAAALEIQDPRERPADLQEQADAMHARFADKTSDFATYLNLWRYLREQQQETTSSAFRRMCKKEFLNYLRVREWQELDGQLLKVCRQVGLPSNTGPANAPAIHRSLLAGLLSHIGMRDPERRDYLGSRGTRFAIFPGSALFKRPPPFVMSAELVETSRLWARTNAAIEPEWAEPLAAHLVKRSYSDPHWEKSRGAVVALEKVLLYGVPIVSDRRVDYAAVDPEGARELFIRHALVQGEWETGHRFLYDNQAVIEEAAELENRTRRRDIVVDDESLFTFYDARVPAEVVSAAHFDAWWKDARQQDPELLAFTLDLVVNDTAAEVDAQDYPDVWQSADGELPLHYEFEPGAQSDGVTVEVPLSGLPQLDPSQFSWPVPGLRLELVTALIRSLPKGLRTNFVPAPNVAKAFLAAVPAGEQPLLPALERYLLHTTGVAVPPEAWGLDRVPPHLRLSFRVTSEGGDVVGSGKDLERLQRDLAGAAGAAVSAAGRDLERDGLTDWDFDELPRRVGRARAGHRVEVFPALVDCGESVGIRVLSREAHQLAAMRSGVVRLIALSVRSPSAALLDSLDNAGRLALSLAPHANVAALLDDCWTAAVEDSLGDAELPWTKAAYDDLRQRVAKAAPLTLAQIVDLVKGVLVAANQVDVRLSGRVSLALLPAYADMKAQLSRLVHPGFVTDAGLTMVRRYPTYLAAIDRRIDAVADDPRRDATLMATVTPLVERYLAHAGGEGSAPASANRLREVRFMIEELRVSLWAQQFRTVQSVSPQRVQRALAEL